jgi:hypothetical protein
MELGISCGQSVQPMLPLAVQLARRAFATAAAVRRVRTVPYNDDHDKNNEDDDDDDNDAAILHHLASPTCPLTGLALSVQSDG